MRLRTILMVALVGLMSAGAVAQQPGQRGEGQQGRGGPGGGFFFGGGGGFTSRLSLLRYPEVQKELELADEQVKEIQKIQEELRARFRPPGGPGGPGGDGRRGRGNNERREGEPGGQDRGSRAIPADWYFVQAQAQAQEQGQGRRGGFQITDEQRAQFEKQRLEQAREEKAKLAEILLPHQIERLNQIFVQVAGVEALRDEDIAKELGVSEAQTAKIAEMRRANQEAMGEQMRALFGGGGDREANRAKVEEIRKANDAKLLTVLTPEQQKKFEEMKGKPFKMPEGFGRGGRGGPGGGPGGPGRRGGDNNRN